MTREQHSTIKCLYELINHWCYEDGLKILPWSVGTPVVLMCRRETGDFLEYGRISRIDNDGTLWIWLREDECEVQWEYDPFDPLDLSLDPDAPAFEEAFEELQAELAASYSSPT